MVTLGKLKGVLHMNCNKCGTDKLELYYQHAYGMLCDSCWIRMNTYVDVETGKVGTCPLPVPNELIDYFKDM